MFANDGQRLFDAVTFAPLVLVGPLVLIGGIAYLLAVIGPWSLLGILIFFIFDVIQVFYYLPIQKTLFSTVSEKQWSDSASQLSTRPKRESV